jgi:hypothetical protein
MLDTKKLDKILEAFKSPPVARVGVLGDHAARKEGELTNAQIGAYHEFGTETLPIRSFLRQPITNRLQQFLDKSNAFSKKAMDEVIKSGSLKVYVAKIGVVGEAVVAEAFRTGGFGDWEPSNMTHKKNHETLVETQQLRNSITSDVKE